LAASALFRPHDIQEQSRRAQFARRQSGDELLLGKVRAWGEAGSIRLDAVRYGSNGQILQIFDLKTGNAGLSQRMEQIYRHLPNGQRPLSLSLSRDQKTA
jgi:hypothetical protein